LVPARLAERQEDRLPLVPPRHQGPQREDGHSTSHDGRAGRHHQAAKIETVTKFFGGQGTINVNSWSPDSKKFAYVVYEALP